MPVYFLQATEGGPVKIGHSVAVDARRAQLETRYGKPLALLGTLPGGRDEERALHERFAHLRLGRTEQFQPAPELMSFIDRPLLASPNPSAAEVMKSVVDEKPSVFGIKGSPEWKAWLEEAAKFGRVSVACYIDQATAWYAAKAGFTTPPPKR